MKEKLSPGAIKFLNPSKNQLMNGGNTTHEQSKEPI
jgi:hypothetical protein